MAVILILFFAYYGVYCWELTENAKYLENVSKGQYDTTVQMNVIAFLENVIAIIISVVISSFLTTLFLEKKSRNEIYSDAVSDIINQSNLKLHFNSADSISLSLQNRLTNNSIPSDIAECIGKKIFVPNTEYYYSNCSIKIECKVLDNCIEKTIKKEMKIRSYKQTHVFGKGNYFIVARQRTSPKLGDKQLECETVQIRSSTITKTFDKEDLHPIKTVQLDELSKRQGFTSQYEYQIPQEIKISNDEDLTVTVIYKTRTPLDDLDYVFRVPCACKSLHFDYSVMTDGYEVNGYAFGFLDDANYSVNEKENKSNIQIDFRDWIFFRDGICVNIKKINN